MILKRNGKNDIEKLRSEYDQERQKVVSAGGLHVIGTAHHESTRIDAQLRGRAGRQGDPGSSQFIVSLDDDIWKKFGKSDIKKIRINLQKYHHLKGTPISLRNVKFILRNLQRKVECENQAIRKDVLNYDLVVHAQRQAIYNWRKGLVTREGYNLEDLIRDTVNDLGELNPDRNTFAKALQIHFNATFDLPDKTNENHVLTEIALSKALSLLRQQEEVMGRDLLWDIGQRILLQTIDSLWTEHLHDLEMVEEGIGYEAYAGIDPVIAWSKKAANMWQDLIRLIRCQAVTLWFQVESK